MSSDDSGQPRRLNYVSVPTRQFIFSTNVPRWILLLVGALVIGTFDILFAIIFWYLRAHVAPSRIFQSVAAGLYGKASFTGGARTALVGAALHYFIALCIVLVYWVIRDRKSVV